MRRSLYALALCIASAALTQCFAQTAAPKPAPTPASGLTPTSVRIGTLLPTEGGLAETGAAMRDVLTAFFAELNERGGVGGRRVELQFAETGDTPAATAANVRRLITEGQVFALVGGLSVAADKELAALARELEVPFVGPTTLMPATGANRHVFYLNAGVAEQARALVNFHARHKSDVPVRSDAPAAVTLVGVRGELGEAATAAAADQCKKMGCGSVASADYERGKFDVAFLVKNMQRAESVFFFGAGEDAAAFLKEAGGVGWRPRVYLLGVLAGTGLVNSVPQSFKGRVFTAFPTVPSDISPAGVTELRALLEKQRVPARNLPAQFAAYAAAKIFVEGMRRAGGEPSREKLVAALEGLNDFETGVSPRITYGPNRRVGAAGAYVMLVDTDKKKFVPAGGWVKAF